MNLTGALVALLWLALVAYVAARAAKAGWRA